jgi:hypothetical protein
MTTRTLITVIYSLTIAVTILWLLIEHGVCAQIHQENTELLRRLNDATERLAENQQRADRAASSTDQVSEANRVPSDVNSSGAKVQQLRGEIAKLLQAHQQAEALREDSRQTRIALESHKKEDRAARQAASGNVSSLQIVKAEYWTDHQRMDVTDELQDRIRGDNLKAIANNNIKGDPEFGQTKHLTIEYNFGGVTRTNEFRENDMIVLPAE